VTGARVPFASLTLHDDAASVQTAIARVVASGWLVLGPELEAFEAELASACATTYAVGVGNGTDALALTLRAAGIGRGDEVITTPISAAYTALAIVMCGAQPAFADVDPERLTLDPGAVARAVTPRTRAVLPVHLYGQPADMEGLAQVASRNNLALIEDCCQAHLATARSRPVGTFGVGGALSFYPTKNLGALGDGGAVITNDRAIAERVKLLRNGGQTTRYRHEALGVNSRLDELQAAVLRARLPLMLGWTARRRALATAYRRALAPLSTVVVLAETDPGHVYHLGVVRAARRDELQRHLHARGIETLVHYPVPIPHQPAFQSGRPDMWPVATRACREVLSLPLYPSLADAALGEVVSAVAAFEEN
jgi:dTDP-3-amino-3,4,6-trideoxy-alpha-D-glucose transaminase